jgi:hypothetical protein
MNRNSRFHSIAVRVPRWLYWILADRARSYGMPVATLAYFLLARTSHEVDASKTDDEVTQWLLEMWDKDTLEQLQAKLKGVDKDLQDDQPPW